MSFLDAVQVIALLSTGFKAGVLFGDQMAARFARPGLSPSSFVKYQQVQILRWEKFMPAFGGITVLSGLAWLGLTWARWEQIIASRASLAAIAFVSAVLAFVASIGTVA